MVQLTPLAVRVVLVSSFKSKTAECDWSGIFFFLNRKEEKKNLNLNTTEVKLKKNEE